MTAYYNEFDPKAAAWLRELIAAGLIAEGDVDDRSIADVGAADLRGYVQCHFFAGIGGWSLALRQAGWPDDRPVWTGSCPCQPFSVAGQGKGTADERHLWPEFARLIGECRPSAVFGEQVASKAGRRWLSTVRAEMEAMGYGVGAADLCAASVWAPHIRQRLWFRGERLADASIAGSQGWRERRDSAGECVARARGVADGLADAAAIGHDGWRPGEASDEPGSLERSERLCDVDGLADAERAGRTKGRAVAGHRPTSGMCGDSRPRPPHVDWRDADWLYCRDGKWRPVEPADERMADGISAVLDNCIHEVEIDAKISLAIAFEAMRAVRNKDGAQALWTEVGGRFGFPEATVLLAIMCKHAWEMGVVADSGTARSTKDRVKEALRTLQHCSQQDARPPSRREFPEQLARQLASAMPKLSRKSTPPWKALRLFTAGPLAHHVQDRVALLRGYGNAIVPAVAAEFIEASEEAVSDAFRVGFVE